MKIDSNYKQRGLNFGKLKSIKYDNGIFSDACDKGYADFMRVIKESKAFNEFFKQYDVDMFIKNDEQAKELCMILKTLIRRSLGNNLYPTIKINVEPTYFSKLLGRGKTMRKPTIDALINKLTEKIKKVTFSDLKSELDNSLLELRVQEYMDGRNNVVLHDTSNNILF